MHQSNSRWRRVGITLGTSLVAPLVLGWAGASQAKDKAATTAPSPVVANATVTPTDLPTARHLALEKQPGIAAFKASLAASIDKAKALEDLCLARIVSPDLPIRRQQASLGVQIAEARLHQAEQETLFAVTRTFYTVLYARQQEKLVDEAVANLKDLKETVEEIVKTGARTDITRRDIDRINILLAVAEGRREEAIAGEQRALAALQEAIGTARDCPVIVPGKELPYPKAEVDQEAVVDLALKRRPEMVQVTQAAEVFALEVKAQGTTHLPSAKTFAAGADLHAQAVPAGALQDRVYRPGAIDVEMPTTLVGHQKARVQVATDLQARAVAVVDKARNLLSLEADDGFLRWREAARKTARYREAADSAEDLATKLRDDFKKEAKVKLDDVIAAGTLSTQLRAQANEALFDLVLSLATLERITAGGLCSDPVITPAP